MRPAIFGNRRPEINWPSLRLVQSGRLRKAICQIFQLRRLEEGSALAVRGFIRELGDSITSPAAGEAVSGQTLEPASEVSRQRHRHEQVEAAVLVKLVEEFASPTPQKLLRAPGEQAVVRSPPLSVIDGHIQAKQDQRMTQQVLDGQTAHEKTLNSRSTGLRPGVKRSARKRVMACFWPPTRTRSRFFRIAKESISAANENCKGSCGFLERRLLFLS